METEQTIPIDGESDIVRARQLARQVAIETGFTQMDQSRIATAVSELARNVVRYATDGRGEMSIRIDGSAPIVCLEIVVRDYGPGIDDVEMALQPGFTSGRGLGLGLSGTKRLMDDMAIASSKEGTIVLIRKCQR